MTSSISIIQRSTCVATFFQPSQRFTGEKLFKFVSPIDWWTLHGSSSNRSPMQHSTYPTIFWKPHDVASKLPLLRSAGFSFSPRFHMAYLNHFSHTLVPNMRNFVPWILPANPAWSSNPASDHTSEVDINFLHISSTDAPGPSSKTSNWCHDGIENFNLILTDTLRLRKKRIYSQTRRNLQTDKVACLA